MWTIWKWEWKRNGLKWTEQIRTKKQRQVFIVLLKFAHFIYSICAYQFVLMRLTTTVANLMSTQQSENKLYMDSWISFVPFENLMKYEHIIGRHHHYHQSISSSNGINSPRFITQWWRENVEYRNGIIYTITNDRLQHCGLPFWKRLDHSWIAVAQHKSVQFSI